MLKILLHLVFRNLKGSGLRTFLNTLVLSMAYVMLLFSQGLYQGWHRQALKELEDTFYGNGWLVAPNYDRYEMVAIEDFRQKVPATLQTAVQQDRLIPLLLHPGVVSPHRRLQNVLLIGIPASQEALSLPTTVLAESKGNVLPTFIGEGTARRFQLHPGDTLMLEWRDTEGALDARELYIARVVTSSIPIIQNNTFWLPLDSLRKMLSAPQAATILVVPPGNEPPPVPAGWRFMSLEELTRDLEQLIRMKSIGSYVFLFILLAMGLLAIFDTQVLSVFRRVKEIGTLLALGMTRKQLVALFTLEGTAQGFLALGLSLVWGAPLLFAAQRFGIPLPAQTSSFGIVIGKALYPEFGLALVGGGALLIMVAATVVSYWPVRRLAQLEPSQALRKGSL